MKNIIDFSCSKVNLILQNLEKMNSLNKDKQKFRILYREKKSIGEKEYIIVKFKGSGSYGNVFQIINDTKEESIIKRGASFIIKVMKYVGKEEPMRTKIIKNEIKNIKKIIYKLKNKKKKNNKKEIINNQITNEYNKLKLIQDYILGIIDIKKCKNTDVIFLKYIKGDDLKILVNKDNLSLNQNEIDFLYLQSLLSVRIFHKILNFSHRDLKLENLFFDEIEKNVKIIDFGFICNKNNYQCFKRYQGTGKYIHCKQNKIFTLKNNKRINSLSKNNSNKNNFTKKKDYSSPDAFSQDLFSLIIICLKIYYENRKIKGGSTSKIYSIFKEYETNFIKYKDKIKDKKHRYINKKILFSKLLKLKDSDIKHNSLKLIINVLRNCWDFDKKDFFSNGFIGKKNSYGNKLASNIIDYLIDELSRNLKPSSTYSYGQFVTDEMIKKTLNDISLLNEIKN